MDDFSKYLLEAVYTGNLEQTYRLILQGANVNTATTDNGMTALMGASRNGYLKIAQLLVEKGANVNASCSWFYKQEHGMTALMLASQEGHLEIVQLLVERGANLNAAMTDGSTALMWASIRGHLEIFKFLVEKGADVNATTSDYVPFFRYTALTYARKFSEDSIKNENRLKIVKFMADREEKTVTNNVCDFIKRNISSYFYTKISGKDD
jgi:ankyrin repeat protein